MATPFTFSGQTNILPNQNDTFAWGTALTNSLLRIGQTGLQQNGAVSAVFLPSATANPAVTGWLRLATTDQITWRDFGNGADCYLYTGKAANSQSQDDLYYQNGTTGTYTQITGSPYAEYNSTAGQSITNNTITIVNFGTKVTDTDNAVTTGAGWVFTVPANKAGLYLLQASSNFTGITAVACSFQCGFQVNGLNSYNGPTQFLTPVAGTWGQTYTTVVNVAAGATIAFWVYQSQGAARSLTTAAADNRIVIKKLT